MCGRAAREKEGEEQQESKTAGSRKKKGTAKYRFHLVSNLRFIGRDFVDEELGIRRCRVVDRPLVKVHIIHNNARHTPKMCVVVFQSNKGRRAHICTQTER